MRIHRIAALGLLLITLLPAMAQNSILEKYARKLTDPRHYVCYRTSTPIKIDGKLNEEAWKQAAETESFEDISGEGFAKPLYDTKARMLWDNQYLYVAAVLEEPNIVANLTKRDTIIYHDNDFEVFIDPDGDGQTYFEIENNARGVVFDLMLTRAYRCGGNFLVQWDCPGLKLAVTQNGTLNNDKDTDKSWTVEMAIPYKALMIDFTNPLKAGNIWRLNFSRVEWLKKGGPEENWVWSATGEINMHMPDRWGFVQFSDQVVGTQTEAFRYPYDRDAYRLVWAMFYEEMAQHAANGYYAQNLNDLNLTDADYASLPKGCNVSLEATAQTFKASVRVPSEKVDYEVDQLGKFTRTPYTK